GAMDGGSARRSRTPRQVQFLEVQLIVSAASRIPFHRRERVNPSRRQFRATTGPRLTKRTLSYESSRIAPGGSFRAVSASGGPSQSVGYEGLTDRRMIGSIAAKL